MKTPFFRLVLCLIMSYLFYITNNQTVAAPLPSTEDFCGVVDYKLDNRNYARSMTANLNVGEPRTVRMIYFLPNDRPYREDVVQRMKDEIRNIQTFYAESMQARGYNMTFKIETDTQGEPVVHRVDGQYPDSYYLDNTSKAILNEIRPVWDTSQNIYFIVIDNSIDEIGIGDHRRALGVGGPWGKSGGTITVSDEFSFRTGAHELGHAFGLDHDFRSGGSYIMSYGPGFNRARGKQGEHQLSGCSADFLAVHPYFNPNTPTERGQPPTIEMTSPSTYPTGSESVSIQLHVSDSEGLHQVILLVILTKSRFLPTGYPEVKACRKLTGEKETVVEFDYDGDIPSTLFTSLSSFIEHEILITAIDINGDIHYRYFTLSEILPEKPPPIPKTLIKISGDNQEGTSGIALPYPLVVEVKDLEYTPLSDIQVTFIVTSGGGKLNEIFTIQNVITDVLGQAKSILTPGIGPNAVEVSVNDGNSVTFYAMGADAVTILRRSDNYQTWGLPAGTRIRLGKGGVGKASNAVAFSPDGQYLAISSGIGIWLYNATTYQELDLLSYRGDISSIAFSPDGKSILTGSNRKLDLWNVATREKMTTFGKYQRYVAFSSDGVIVASSWKSSIKLWNIETGQELVTLKHNAKSIAFSPDGTMLASGGEDGAVKLWDVTTGQNIATFQHKSIVNVVAFSPNGKTLASGSYDNTVTLWDIAMGVELIRIQERKSVKAIAFSPNGKILAWVSIEEGGYKTIKLWNMEMGSPSPATITTCSDYVYSINSITFSPNGKALVSASYIDGIVKVWDLETNSAIDMGHIRLSPSSLSPDGTILASGGHDNIVRLWDIETGKIIYNILAKPKSRIRLVSFSPDGRTLAYRVSGEKFTRLWDVTTKTQVGTIKNKSITCLTFSPDGKMLASAAHHGDIWNPNRITLWDTITGDPITQLMGHTDRIESITFSPDGKMLVSTSLDRTVKLWDVMTKQNIENLVHESSVPYAVFSHDGTILGFPSWLYTRPYQSSVLKLWFQGDIVKLWNIPTRTLTIKEATMVSFSPNSTIVILGNKDGSLSLWDTKTLTLITTFEGGWGRPIFSQDGKTLASMEDTILLADMEALNSKFIPSAPTSVNLTNAPQTELLLNYPNPFNPETWIPFRLAQDAKVTLTIYDVSGKEVRSFDIGHSKAGIYESRDKAIYWDGRNDLGESAASGIYFYHLMAGEYSATKRMVILK